MTKPTIEEMKPYGELSQKAIGLANYFLDSTGHFPPGTNRKVAVWVLADKLESAFSQIRAEERAQQANALPMDEVPEGCDWAITKETCEGGRIVYSAVVSKDGYIADHLQDGNSSQGTTVAEALRAAIARAKE